jgi:hypothetical protein
MRAREIAILMEPMAAFEEGGRVLRLTFSGENRVDQWVSLMVPLLADPRFRPGLVVLSDRTGAHPLETEDVRAIVEFVRAHGESFRGVFWAIVVPDTAAYGMIRMGQTLFGPVGLAFEVFRDLPSAENWLQAALAEGAADPR